MDTTDAMSAAAPARPDTHGMVVIHRGLRRESRLLIELLFRG